MGTRRGQKLRLSIGVAGGSRKVSYATVCARFGVFCWENMLPSVQDFVSSIGKIYSCHDFSLSVTVLFISLWVGYDGFHTRRSVVSRFFVVSNRSFYFPMGRIRWLSQTS